MLPLCLIIFAFFANSAIAYKHTDASYILQSERDDFYRYSDNHRLMEFNDLTSDTLIKSMCEKHGIISLTDQSLLTHLAQFRYCFSDMKNFSTLNFGDLYSYGSHRKSLIDKLIESSGKDIGDDVMDLYLKMLFSGVDEEWQIEEYKLVIDQNGLNIKQKDRQIFSWNRSINRDNKLIEEFFKLRLFGYVYLQAAESLNADIDFALSDNAFNFIAQKMEEASYILKGKKDIEEYRDFLLYILRFAEIKTTEAGKFDSIKLDQSKILEFIEMMQRYPSVFSSFIGSCVKNSGMSNNYPNWLLINKEKITKRSEDIDIFSVNVRNHGDYKAISVKNRKVVWDKYLLMKKLYDDIVNFFSKWDFYQTANFDEERSACNIVYDDMLITISDGVLSLKNGDQILFEGKVPSNLNLSSLNIRKLKEITLQSFFDSEEMKLFNVSGNAKIRKLFRALFDDVRIENITESGFDRAFFPAEVFEMFKIVDSPFMLGGNSSSVVIFTNLLLKSNIKKLDNYLFLRVSNFLEKIKRVGRKGHFLINDQGEFLLDIPEMLPYHQLAFDINMQELLNARLNLQMCNIVKKEDWSVDYDYIQASLDSFMSDNLSNPLSVKDDFAYCSVLREK